jgi:hypothetical protein
MKPVGVGLSNLHPQPYNIQIKTHPYYGFHGDFNVFIKTNGWGGFLFGIDRTSACFLDKPAPTRWFLVECCGVLLGAAAVFGQIGFLTIGVKCFLSLQIEKERAMNAWDVFLIQSIVPEPDQCPINGFMSYC